MAFKVFISYSTKDLEIVNKVRDILLDSQIEVYIAEYSANPGDVLSSKIHQAIETCDIFILLWSRNSKNSEWVPQEIGIAKGLGKIILPVVLNHNLKLPGFISDLKYLDATTNLQDGFNWLEGYIKNLAFKKIQKDKLVLLGLGAAFFYLLSQSK